MRVKRYVVDSMPDALQKIRMDLGSDAVILSTKDVKYGGFLGMFAKKKIEVVAALDPSAVQKPAVPRANRSAAAPAMLSQLKSELESTQHEQSLPLPQPLAQVQSIAQAQSVAQPQPSSQPQAVPFSPQPRSPLAEVQPSASEEKVDTLLAEIKHMKDMMKKLSLTAVTGQPVRPEWVQRYEQRLIEQELNSELVQQLLDHAQEELDNSLDEYAEADVRQALRRQIVRIFGTDRERALDTDARVFHFVGPTGVGKTTTIAKLAAEQAIKHRRKVAFITSDTYRIAAIDQLKTYASILNAPIEVVFSPKDLNRAFEQLQDMDMIFMDTAGRNYRNEMYVSELNTLLQTNGKSETYLVLSLTTKYRDMKAITENFEKFKLDKLILTKWDETDSIGNALNLANDFNLTISYVSNGQNVPEDIEIFDEERVTDFILGDLSDD